MVCIKIYHLWEVHHFKLKQCSEGLLFLETGLDNAPILTDCSWMSEKLFHKWQQLKLDKYRSLFTNKSLPKTMCILLFFPSSYLRDAGTQRFGISYMVGGHPRSSKHLVTLNLSDMSLLRWKVKSKSSHFGIFSRHVRA